MAQNEGVFDKVKRTFLRMASSFESEAPRIDPLTLINIPPTMARRDAAYDRASKLLRDNLFARGDRERNIIYKDSLELLDIAIESSSFIQAPVKRGVKSLDKEQLLVYLKMLRKSVCIAQSLAEQQMQIASGERDLCAFLGSQASGQFHSADEIYADSEMNVYHSIVEFLEAAEPALLRNREQCKRAFEKTELDRYAKSLCESETFYSKYGMIQ